MVELRMCKKCGITKPMESFVKASRTKSGRLYKCKDCDSKNKKYKYANDIGGVRTKALNRDKAKVKEINARHRAKNRERLNAEQRNRYHADLEGNRKRAKFYIRRQRQKIIRHYAPDGRCMMCGIDDYDSLQIDHVNADGQKDHSRNNNQSSSMLSKILKNDFPPDYQILCANCNHIKRTMTQTEFEAAYPERKGMYRDVSAWKPSKKTER